MMNNKNIPKPQKRHPALVPLSHDHHQGLLLCWKIRMGLSKNVEYRRIANYVKHFFDDHLKRHFKEEEDILLTRLDEKDEKRKETESQHQELYLMREGMSNEEGLDAKLESFERKLEAHIRFEERDLFPYLQQSFDEGTLQEVKAKLEKEEPFRDDWHDIFWEQK